MGCLRWEYFCLLSFLFLHSQFPFSSSLSSNSECSALLHFSHLHSLSAFPPGPAPTIAPPAPSISNYFKYPPSINDRSNFQMCENSYPKTGSWKEDKDCCTWDGVVCDNSTRHVVGLDLGCCGLSGSIPSNSTLFLLRHLRTLNLAGNDFGLSLISPKFGKFQSLTHLNLSSSAFSGQIPYELSQLSSLVSLDLSYNDQLLIKTPVWKRVIGNLTQLRELLLDRIDMTSIRPNSLMMNLSSLTTLSLHQCNLQGTFEVNVFRLPCIQTLDLGNNPNLEGSLPKSNWSRSSLKFLNLSSTSFSGELPDSIGSLKFLEYLDLARCNFTEAISMSLGQLTQITFLDLSKNNFTGVIPTSIGNLKQLIHLDLSFNSFNGFLPSSIFELPNLIDLSLKHNQLVGPLPNHVSGLNLLIVLSLSSNFLNGTLPSWLFSLTSLDYLDLSYNMLQGFPRSISRPGKLITVLDLSSNNLSIMFDLEMFSNLKNLKYADFSHNNLFVSTNNNLTFTLPNLERLSLSFCNIREFPIFLRVATNLQLLDLSNNRIHGQIPKWLGAVGRNSLGFLDLSHNFLTSIDKIPWTNLFLVDLRNNLLQGTFPTLNDNLEYVFASNNNLTGEIPSLICNASSLKVLDLSHNNLTGEIPSLICNPSSLKVLDLSHNNFSGTIPRCLVLSNVLSVLNLGMNSLNGTIPATFSKGNYLRNIDLNGNQLEGPLPRSLENFTKLEFLDLGNNKINDTFPYWLGSLVELRVLVIRSNKFQGRIGNPKTKFPFPNLRILDISNNEFSGPLPKKYFKYLKAMMNVDEGKVVLKYMGDHYYLDSLNVMMKGLYIEFERIQTIFTTIDFSNNKFTGEMPQIIGRLKSLKGLNFSHNNLTSYIPSSFGNLTNLEWLDLSFNKLRGEIPKQLADLPWLAVLKLSHNQLIGQIPSGRQFNTFDNDSYAENLGLCGFPLSRTCNNHTSKQPPPSTLQQEDNLEPKSGFGWQAVSIGYGCGVVFGTIMGYLMFKIGKPKWIVRMVQLEQHILLRRLKNNACRSGGRKKQVKTVCG